MDTNNNIEKEILALVKQKVSLTEYENCLSQLKYNPNASKSDIAFFMPLTCSYAIGLRLNTARCLKKF